MSSFDSFGVVLTDMCCWYQNHPIGYVFTQISFLGCTHFLIFHFHGRQKRFFGFTFDSPCRKCTLDGRRCSVVIGNARLRDGVATKSFISVPECPFSLFWEIFPSQSIRIPFAILFTPQSRHQSRRRSEHVVEP